MNKSYHSTVAGKRHILPADWQPVHIQRLWSHWSSMENKGEYFSYQCGPGVVAFLHATGRLVGDVLDYGCGPGFLIEYLLMRNVSCRAADVNPEAVENTDARYRSYPNFKGCIRLDGLPSSIEPESFNVVTCVETLEHLDDATLHQVVDDVRRILKPGGIALFTTPFNEDLKRNVNYCPFCDSVYHRVQHMRSFNVESMTALLTSHAFNVEFCGNLSFRNFQRNTLPKWYDISPKTAAIAMRSAGNRVIDRILQRHYTKKRTFRERLQGGGGHLAAVAVR